MTATAAPATPQMPNVMVVPAPGGVFVITATFVPNATAPASAPAAATPAQRTKPPAPAAPRPAALGCKHPARWAAAGGKSPCWNCPARATMRAAAKAAS